jgi:hypothetical protein
MDTTVPLFVGLDYSQHAIQLCIFDLPPASVARSPRKRCCPRLMAWGRKGGERGR